MRIRNTKVACTVLRSEIVTSANPLYLARRRMASTGQGSRLLRPGPRPRGSELANSPKILGERRASSCSQDDRLN